MDYPDRWKKKLANDEERNEIAKKHWTPRWWYALVVIGLMIAFALIFWPRG